MSNEELVARIQAGDQNGMTELWYQVEKFIAWKAQRIMPTLGESTVIEVDDLIQAGYFALVSAVATYSPGEGEFVKWLSYYLQTAFAEAAGYRTEKMRKDPSKCAVSLDRPIADDSDTTMGEIVPDQLATAAMETIEDNLWHEQLRKALEDILNEIPEKYGDVVRMRFFEGKTLGSISQEQNVTRERVRQLEHKGIKEMRRPKNKNRLKPFIEFDYFGGTGLTAFRQTGMSVQERYLVRKEKSTDQR